MLYTCSSSVLCISCVSMLMLCQISTWWPDKNILTKQLLLLLRASTVGYCCFILKWGTVIQNGLTKCEICSGEWFSAFNCLQNPTCTSSWCSSFMPIVNIAWKYGLETASRALWAGILWLSATRITSQNFLCCRCSLKPCKISTDWSTQWKICTELAKKKKEKEKRFCSFGETHLNCKVYKTYTVLT